MHLAHKIQWCHRLFVLHSQQARNSTVYTGCTFSFWHHDFISLAISVCVFPILALCPDLKDPDNGKLVIMTGTSLGDTAGFICNSGFELMGSETVTC